MAAEEDIQNLSPEEIAELQRKNCVFCHIVSGDIQSKKVYEDEECVAILDINPANPGHMLLLPKKHYSILPQVPEYTVAHLFKVAKGLSRAALKALNCQGTNFFVANGVAAGQKAPHFMIHIIPREEKDSLDSLSLTEKKGLRATQEKIAAMLRESREEKEEKAKEEKKEKSPEKRKEEKPGEEKEDKEEKEEEEKSKEEEKREEKKEDEKGDDKGAIDLDTIARVLGQ